MGEPTDSTHQVKLTALNCRAGQIRVNLRPLSLKNMTLSKELPCMSESLRNFRSTGSEPLGRQKLVIKPGSAADCLSCGDAWLYWLDPTHWLEAGWSQTRAVVIGSVILAVITFILLSYKVGTLCCCCCSCARQKKK